MSWTFFSQWSYIFVQLDSIFIFEYIWKTVKVVLNCTIFIVIFVRKGRFIAVPQLVLNYRTDLFSTLIYSLSVFKWFLSKTFLLPVEFYDLFKFWKYMYILHADFNKKYLQLYRCNKKNIILQYQREKG